MSPHTKQLTKIFHAHILRVLGIGSLVMLLVITFGLFFLPAKSYLIILQSLSGSLLVGSLLLSALIIRKTSRRVTQSIVLWVFFVITLLLLSVIGAAPISLALCTATLLLPLVGVALLRYFLQTAAASSLPFSSDFSFWEEFQNSTTMRLIALLSISVGVALCFHIMPLSQWSGSATLCAALLFFASGQTSLITYCYSKEVRIFHIHEYRRKMSSVPSIISPAARTPLSHDLDAQKNA